LLWPFAPGNGLDRRRGGGNKTAFLNGDREREREREREKRRREREKETEREKEREKEREREREWEKMWKLPKKAIEMLMRLSLAYILGKIALDVGRDKKHCPWGGGERGNRKVGWPLDH
jgi:hypothetical protein